MPPLLPLSLVLALSASLSPLLLALPASLSLLLLVSVSLLLLLPSPLLFELVWACCAQPPAAGPAAAKQATGTPSDVAGHYTCPWQKSRC
jgi:hypothetical protein